MKIQVLVFMSEIKFALTLKKSNFLFLMYLFTIIKLLPTLGLSRQKTNFFLAISRQFGLFSVFRGYTIGWKRCSFAPRK